MGIQVEREQFVEADYVRFAARLQEELAALQALLARPGFGVGPTSIGAELELFLVDARAHPLPLNHAVLARILDERVTVEMDKFNLECNARPVTLAGAPFAALAADLEGAAVAVKTAAAVHGARPVAIGILPTLRAEHLRSEALTNLPRYRALAAGIRQLRREPFRIRIDGDESLALDWDDITLEGANTSLQIHLRVAPEAFADCYNAAQLATAPVLAAAGNSPVFLGRRLWHETRVALFEQSTDPQPGPGWQARGDLRLPPRITFGRGWVRRGAVELFRESVALHPPLLPLMPTEDLDAALTRGDVPKLTALRLHSGTVYPWNRPVYDPAGGGHLRIEMRALPAGPTMTDMMANAAFLLGLTLGLAPEMEQLLPAVPFPHAERSFYRAAREGLDAELAWPAAAPPSPRQLPARNLVPALVPLARHGLASAGVNGAEVDRLLGVIEARVRTGQTGAVWQRRMLARLEGDVPRARALELLLERYRTLSESGDPVHTWP
jgi:hypothetical protein